MKNWRLAVDKFLNGWKEKDKVVAAMACGSYVTGSPTEHSDIDLHLILSEDMDWVERGNEVVDGILIEYFANPAEQIESYFKGDYENTSYISPTMFLTGEVIFDKEGIIDKLKLLAKSYRERKFPVLKVNSLELMKYHIWDALDNVQDSAQIENPAFYYVYYYALNLIYEAYSKYLQYPISEVPRVYDTITKESTRKKYLLQPFPDKEFVNLFSKAIKLEDKENMMKGIEFLIKYTLKEMGGFKIDGWKIRSPIEKK
jgi:predicted nucleotidyltransferase